MHGALFARFNPHSGVAQTEHRKLGNSMTSNVCARESGRGSPMYDYEADYPSSEISGTPVMYCDVCGMPTSSASYLTSGNGSSPAVCDRLLRVCPGCYTEIERGDAEVFADGAGTLEADIGV